MGDIDTEEVLVSMPDNEYIGIFGENQPTKISPKQKP